MLLITKLAEKKNIRQTCLFPLPSAFGRQCSVMPSAEAGQSHTNRYSGCRCPTSFPVGILQSFWLRQTALRVSDVNHKSWINPRWAPDSESSLRRNRKGVGSCAKQKHEVTQMTRLEYWRAFWCGFQSVFTWRHLPGCALIKREPDAPPAHGDALPPAPVPGASASRPVQPGPAPGCRNG